MGKYADLAEKIGKLVDDKNAAYGSSFDQAGDFLKLLYPNGIPVDSYTDMLCVVRIFDKLKRIATRKDAFGESPYGDIVGYGLLGLFKDGGSQKVENTEPEPYTPTPDDVRQAREEQAAEKRAELVQKIIDHRGVKKEIAPATPPPLPPTETAPEPSTTEKPEKKEEAAPVKKPNCAICGLEVEGTIPEEELKSGKTIVHNDCYSKYLREQKLKAKT
jgi:hypothetical protein